MSKQVKKTKPAAKIAELTIDETKIREMMGKHDSAEQEKARLRHNFRSTASTILQYLVIGTIGMLIFGFWHSGIHIHIEPLSGPAVLFFSLACAFTWVEILKWGVTKPFTCIKCMSGWIALLFALVFHVDHWYLYWPGGLFIGALFEAIKMRWL